MSQKPSQRAGRSVFSAEQVKDLRSALRRHDDDLIRWLDWCVLVYRRDRDDAQQYAALDAALRTWMHETCARSDALFHHLQDARLTGSEPYCYFQRFLDWGIEDFDRFVSLLASVPTHLRAGLARNPPPQAGRPRDSNRHALETATAAALRDRGYRVTKGRDGTLHRVLRVLLPAAGIQAGHGEDLSRSVKRAVDRMNLRTRYKI